MFLCVSVCTVHVWCVCGGVMCVWVVSFTRESGSQYLLMACFFSLCVRVRACVRACVWVDVLCVGCVVYQREWESIYTDGMFLQSVRACARVRACVCVCVCVCV